MKIYEIFPKLRTVNKSQKRDLERMEKVGVLLSTYNGEKYLKEQLDSILNQTITCEIWVRDDGSTDQTLTILKEYQKNKGIYVLYGHNIGVGNSFMDLLYHVSLQYDYYAFSDQDDIWLPNKVSKAIDKIKDVESACLYASNQTLVDKDGNYIRQRFDKKVDHCLEQIICSNLLSGCTMVFNRELFKMLSDPTRRPSEQLLRVRLHDVWTIMVAQTCGTVIYDSDSYILYRQHENNVVGGFVPGKKKKILSGIKRIFHPSMRRGRSRVALEIYQNYRDLMLPQVVEQLKIYAFYNKSLKDTLSLAMNFSLTQYTGENTFFYFLKVILHLF